MTAARFQGTSDRDTYAANDDNGPEQSLRPGFLLASLSSLTLSHSSPQRLTRSATTPAVHVVITAPTPTPPDANEVGSDASADAAAVECSTTTPLPRLPLSPTQKHRVFSPSPLRFHASPPSPRRHGPRPSIQMTQEEFEACAVQNDFLLATEDATSLTSSSAASSFALARGGETLADQEQASCSPRTSAGRGSYGSVENEDIADCSCRPASSSASIKSRHQTIFETEV